MWKNILAIAVSLVLIVACKPKPDIPVERKPQVPSAEKQQIADERIVTTAYAYEIVDQDTPQEISLGSTPAVQVKVRNTSNRTWPEKGNIMLGYRWTDEKGKGLPKLGGQAIVKKETPISDVATFNCLLKNCPAEAGQYYLVWDMQERGVCWFGGKGATPLRIPVEIK